MPPWLAMSRGGFWCYLALSCLLLFKEIAKYRIIIWRDKNLSLYLHQKNEYMPTILLAFGLRFYFYSEEHMPIHVHVENADGRAKFSLEPNVELVKNEGMKPKDLKKAKALCETFQEEFIEKWHEHMDDNDE